MFLASISTVIVLEYFASDRKAAVAVEGARQWPAYLDLRSGLGEKDEVEHALSRLAMTCDLRMKTCQKTRR